MTKAKIEPKIEPKKIAPKVEKAPKIIMLRTQNNTIILGLQNDKFPVNARISMEFVSQGVMVTNVEKNRKALVPWSNISSVEIESE